MHYITTNLVNARIQYCLRRSCQLQDQGDSMACSKRNRKHAAKHNGLCELSAHVAVITSYTPLPEALELLGKPTSSNGVGKILKYPLASCIFAICKRQHIKKYMIHVHVSSVMATAWCVLLSLVSMHDTDHLTHLIHPAHGARTIRNTVPTTACLLAIRHACFFLGIASLIREYIALDSAYFLRRDCESSRAPSAGLLHEDRTENQPTPNIHTAHRHTGNCN